MSRVKDVNNDSGGADGEHRALDISTGGASVLILVQMFTKLLTFGLNQVLIRFISPAIIGIAAYFEFISASILFISREGERLAIQRLSDAPGARNKVGKNHFSEGSLAGTVQSVINFGFIPLFLGVPLSVIFFTWRSILGFGLDGASTFTYYKESLFIVCASVLIELAAEPLYAKNQFELNMKRRSKIESVAVFSRCIVTCTLVMSSHNISEHYKTDYEGIAIMAFALGQLTYSSVVAALYFYDFQVTSTTNTDATNRYRLCTIESEDNSFYFNPRVMSLWKTIGLQMIFKHFLTEGDKFVMNYFFDIAEQGIYSVIGNYCSMLARLLFQPIEESVRLTFTKVLSNNSNEGRKESLISAKILCIFYLNLSILIVLAGFTNVNFMMRIILSSRLSVWESTSLFDVFPFYILYIPFLAFNGISEALFDCVATENQIKRFSWFMTYMSCMFFVSSWFLIRQMKFGLHGLILTNILNMSARIIYCSTTLANYYRSNQMGFTLTACLKRSKNAIGTGIFFMTMQRIIIGETFSHSLSDVCKSAIICSFCLACLMYSEKNLLYRVIKKKN